MSQITDLSTLPKRMRYAADVMEEAARRVDIELGQESPSGSSWDSRGLRECAQRWEDAAAVEREQLILDLAREMFVAGGRRDCPTRDALDHGGFLGPARVLIESGWRKGSPA